MLSGGCKCGQVQYETSEEPTAATACHCLECRKDFDEPFAPWFHVSNASLTWSAKPDLVKKSNIAERGYCSKCGTPVTMQYFLQPERNSLSLRTIRSTTSLPIAEHIFLGEKEESFAIPEDGATRYQEFDPPFEQKLQKWKEVQVSSRSEE